MTGKKLSCVAISFALFVSAANAQWTVTDPGSYSYYVEQINQQVKMVEAASKQVETMGGVLTETQKIQRNLTGHYNRATGLVNRIKGISDAAGRESSGGIFGEAKKWGNVGRKIGGAGRAGVDSTGRVVKDVGDFAGDDLYTDTKSILDEVFTDPRAIENKEDRYRSLSRRYQMQQGALKEVVARAERTLGSVKDRLKLVQELAEMIDKTENQKDAQDLTNRILVEVLATLIDMLQIAALSNQAEALNKYQGASDAGMQERKKLLDGAQTSTSSVEKMLNKTNGNYKTF